MQGAQERLQGLLDEQGVFHAQVQAELEKGNVDRQKLQDLLEVEKSKHTVPEQGLKAEQAAQVKPGQESEDYEKSCNEHNCSPPIQVADQIELEAKVYSLTLLLLRGWTHCKFLEMRLLSIVAHLLDNTC
jgi:sRNA-binding protein